MAEPIEDIKGRAKEAAGAVMGSESMKNEGEAQQDKAAAQEEAARKEREAREAHGDAAAAEAEERAHR